MKEMWFVSVKVGQIVYYSSDSEVLIQMYVNDGKPHKVTNCNL